MPGRASRPPGRECTPGAELPERLLWTYRGQFPSKVELESGVTVPWAFIPDSSIHSRNMTVSMLAQFFLNLLGQNGYRIRNGGWAASKLAAISGLLKMVSEIRPPVGGIRLRRGNGFQCVCLWRLDGHVFSLDTSCPSTSPGRGSNGRLPI